MGREIYNIINDMAEVLNASQMQKLQEVLINRLSENNTVDYLQTVYQAINNSCGEDSDYCKRYNYVFYRIEDKYIRIINLYHEKEDFLYFSFSCY